MKIFVCIKQVPDTETKLKISADQNGVDEVGVKWVINPYDEFAIEEALKIKEANGGAPVVTAVTLGPKSRATDALRTALAMGADDAIVIDHAGPFDTFSISRALAKVIQSEGGGQFIFTGKLAIDDNQASVSQMLAEFLSIPHVTGATKLTVGADKSTIEREIDGGSREVIEISGAVVVGANKGLNIPRYASLPGIMKAKKKPVKEVSFASLGIESTDSKVSLSGFKLPAEKPPIKMLAGDSSAQTKELVNLLRNEAKVI